MAFYLIIALIWIFLCFFILGPWGFLLSPLVLIVVLDMHSSYIILSILYALLFIIWKFYGENLYYKKISLLSKYKTGISIFGSYLGLILGALSTLTYADAHWWMLFSYLLFLFSQLLFTVSSWSVIDYSNNPIIYGMESVNLFICILISPFPIYLMFGSIGIQIEDFIFLYYDKYEGGVLVSILCLLTFSLLSFLLASTIRKMNGVFQNWHFHEKVKIVKRKNTLLGVLLSLIINALIIFSTIYIIKLIH